MTVLLNDEAFGRAPVPGARTGAGGAWQSWRETPAHIIRSDEEAISAARTVAGLIADGAAKRDRERILPFAEVDAVSQAGLWAINVPASHGGAGVSYATVGRVFAIISAADPNVGQIHQNHNSAVHWLQKLGTAWQQEHFLGAILRGARFGNASSEAGGGKADHISTTITPDGDGFRINGVKAYSTGALLSHFITVIAVDAEGRRQVAILPADAPGLTVIDDWASFGQRTTASGTVRIENVFVPASHVVPIYLSYELYAQDAVSQISHVGIDLGIADAAIRDAIAFVRQFSRAPKVDGIARAVDDPYVIAETGRLKIQYHAAEAMLERAGRILDQAVSDPSPARNAGAVVAVAEAKVLAHEVAIEATNRLFELAGTRSTIPPHAFDRHWRNARVHTLHDPVRWKYNLVGRYYLDTPKGDETEQG